MVFVHNCPILHQYPSFQHNSQTRNCYKTQLWSVYKKDIVKTLSKQPAMLENKTIIVGLPERESLESKKSHRTTREFADDDGVDDDDVSDLSDHDSHADDHDFVFSSMPQGYRSDTVRKCFHPSMVPEGLQAPPMALKQLLVLKNTASMKSLTAGSEHDDIPRLPSRNRIHSVSSPVLSRYEQRKRSTMNNASWDEPPKPCGSTGLSSNPLLSRFHPSMSMLGKNSSKNLLQGTLRSNKLTVSSHSRELRTETTRRPPSRTDLLSRALAVSVPGRTDSNKVTGNATWNQHGTPEAPPGTSAIRNNLFLEKMTFSPQPQQERSSQPPSNDIMLRLVSSPLSDSAPLRPNRRASNGGATGQFQG